MPLTVKLEAPLEKIVKVTYVLYFELLSIQVHHYPVFCRRIDMYNHVGAVSQMLSI